jgi:hypothetical protein
MKNKRMKTKCDFSDEIWASAFPDPTDISIPTNEHIAHCDECAHLSRQITAWKSDRASDNPFMTQKVMDKVTSNDLHYNKTNRFVLRLAFSTAIFIGVIIGFVFTLSSQNQLENSTSAEILYQDKIKAFSSETLYNETKTEETQQLLTDIN